MNYKAAYHYNNLQIKKLEELRDKDLQVIVNSNFPHLADGDEIYLTPNGSFTNSLIEADLSHDQTSELFRSNEHYCLNYIDEFIIDNQIQRLKTINLEYIDKVMYN